LIIIGDGEERVALQELCNNNGLQDKVTFTGALPNVELFKWYSAADAMLLASSREGWANVLLESMACGTPVVAAHIWGTPEVVAEDVAGRLVEQRDGSSFSKVIQALLSAYPDRAKVRAYAEKFSWAETTAAQLQVFKSIAALGNTIDNKK
jgi:glycosyltransferase involved in cell wall biosynthesis